MKERTADQIRRDTTPQKHYAWTYGFLGGLLGVAISFGGWGCFHQDQMRHYPAYAGYALRSQLSGFSLFTKKQSGMTNDQLRYSVLRFGNQDHRYDGEIVRRGWYPKEQNGKTWVFENGAIAPIYTDDASMVFKWPLTGALLITLASVICGLVADYRYRSTIIGGIPFDGSIVATVDEYNEQTRGDGMAYVVKPWKDR